MRIALIQLQAERGLRSRNLRALLELIGRVAERDPCPDLILLPDGCDRGPAESRGWILSTAMCQAFSEIIGSHARDLGLWIATGHAVAEHGRSEHGATLFDPDGDPCRRFGGTGFASPPTIEPHAEPASARPAPSADTLQVVPAIALSDWTAPDSLDLLVVPAGGWNRHSADPGMLDLAALRALARRHHAYVGQSAAVFLRPGAPKGHAVCTALLDRDGRVIAQARPGETDVIHAEIDVTLTLPPFRGSYPPPGRLENETNGE